MLFTRTVRFAEVPLFSDTTKQRFIAPDILPLKGRILGFTEVPEDVEDPEDQESALPSYLSIVEFNYQGKTCYSRLPDASQSFKCDINQPIELLIDPKDPNDLRLHTKVEIMLPVLFMAAWLHKYRRDGRIYAVDTHNRLTNIWCYYFFVSACANCVYEVA